MDDVETGYYLELKSTPEMPRKHTNQSSDGPLAESSSNPFVLNNPDGVGPFPGSEGADNELNSLPPKNTNRSGSFLSEGSEEFLGSVNEMYGLDRVKTKLYKEVFKLYTQRENELDPDAVGADGYDSFGTSRYASFETGRVKRKVCLWLMILLLLSNPILGGYNLYHFSNYSRRFSGYTGSELSSMLAQVGTDAIVIPNFKTTRGDPYSDLPNSVYDEDVNDDVSGSGEDDETTTDRRLFNPLRWFTRLFNASDSADGSDGSGGRVSKEEQELQNKLRQAQEKVKQDLLVVAEFIGKKVSRYCFYEIFGEIIFGLFSLLLLSLCRLPCNNSNSVRFMMPTLFMFYMIIYRLLACYILLTSLKIMFYSMLVYKPSWAPMFPSLVLYLLSFKRLSVADNLYVLRNIYKLDTVNVRLLLIFCIQNVYITFSEALEIFSYFFKVLLSFFKKKILHKSDLNFYSSTESGGFKFLKKCFSRDTFSSTDPHEKYIHSLYNYASDIGTYLKNIEISDYTKGLDDLATKFKNRKQNSNNY
ncbi:hypothetical protein MACJ_001612 [Theileria orientalis]|uniref:Uncharacterized protein n=1 Tax=Theileria orientalis TaxID=68886 RepID=A0A976QRN8_THEOR|nr:hypothetical protein MACJ_001612 [Theileria orientalis]